MGVTSKGAFITLILLTLVGSALASSATIGLKTCPTETVCSLPTDVNDPDNDYTTILSNSIFVSGALGSFLDGNAQASANILDGTLSADSYAYGLPNRAVSAAWIEDEIHFSAPVGRSLDGMTASLWIEVQVVLYNQAGGSILEALVERTFGPDTAEDETWYLNTTHARRYEYNELLGPFSIDLSDNVYAGSYPVFLGVAAYTYKRGGYTTIADTTISGTFWIELPPGITATSDSGVFPIRMVSQCSADFEPDGDVDVDDLAVLAAGFGKFGLGTDADEDGDMDGRDLYEMSVDFGRTDCMP